MRPRLKTVIVDGHGDTVVLCRRALERTSLSDSSGAVRALLAILERGTYEADALPAALADAGHAVPAADVARMIRQLDDWGVLERADADEVLDDATRERHASNLYMRCSPSRRGAGTCGPSRGRSPGGWSDARQPRTRTCWRPSRTGKDAGPPPIWY